MVKRIVILVTLLPWLVFASPLTAGKDFEVLNGSSSQDSRSKKIKVIEFFSYGCPWCYRIEPKLENWLSQQQDKIEFSRVPVLFNKHWIYYAKAYYAAKLLGLEDKLSPLLFKTIQKERRPLTTNAAMINFFVEKGVEKSMAESAFEHSTTIDMQVKEGMASMKAFHINGVPALVIDNRYKVDLQMAGNEARFFKILSFLMAETAKNSGK